MRSCLISLSFLILVGSGCDSETVSGGTEPRSEAWLPGGQLGTTWNTSSMAYEQPSPAVLNAGLLEAFRAGEKLFETPFVTDSAEDSPFGGLGPLWVRDSCISCHPGYGHGKRVDRYRANDHGNGYLLVVTDDTDTYLSSLTGMPQTRAVPPFKPPIDESRITIDWLSHRDGWDNTFPDGETYDLIYPEVRIPADAFYVPLEVTKGGETTPVAYEDLRFRVESTIGVYGAGLLDAIADDDLEAQYLAYERTGWSLNPAIFKDGAWVKQYSNTRQGDGELHPLRFTYGLSRGPLQDGPGANAIWNITNVTRSDRRSHYITETYARVASQDPDVQRDFYLHFPEWEDTGDPETDIYAYLMAKDLPAELSDEAFVNFMVWHRGLGVPAARDLDDPEVELGRDRFAAVGCATCHRPSWTTGPDEAYDPNLFFSRGDDSLPRYPYQKIWPYSDLVQHRLHMKNDLRTGWCRTTPLWGRGLSAVATGASDRLHDARARTVVEAIMWHGAEASDARWTVENFRALSKAERDAVVRFIEAL